MRVIFLGSPGAAIAPLEFLRTKESGVELIAVVSQPPRPIGRSRTPIDPPVAQHAKAKGIVVLQPEKASDPAFLDELKGLHPDLLITAAYGQILSDAFLAIPTRGTINIHPSLLPKYRGATPVPAALLAGDTTTGVSILFTVKKLDAGHLIAQTSSAILPNETAQELTDRMFHLSCKILPDALAALSDPNFVGTPQDEAKVSHCKKISKDDGAVNWNASGHEIINRYRAFSPWPGSFTFLEGKRIGIEGMVLSSGLEPKLPPGKLALAKIDKGILVGTADGNVVITRLKPAGKGSQEAAAFWHGMKSKEELKFSANE